MKIELKLRHVVISVLVVLGLLYAVYSFMKDKMDSRVDTLSTQLYQSEQLVRNYKISVGSLRETVAETRLIVVGKDSEILNLKEERERLRALNIKNVSVIGRLEAQVNVLKDSIVPEGPNIPAKKPWTSFLPVSGGGDKPMLPLPVSYATSDEWMGMSANINSKGVAQMLLTMNPVDLNFVLGEKKTGFLRREPTAVVTTPNPYITFDQSNFAIVDNRKPATRCLLYGGVIGAGIATSVTLFLMAQ